jgi:predicted DsbA family dithiol-disulfide isomerase
MGAHKLIRWAQGAGAQDAVVEGLFRRYFVEGADLGDPDILVAAAEEAGMDGALVRELLGNDADRDKIEQELEVAQRMGIQSVPTFVFDQKFAVVGAESPERMAAALRHCLKTRAQASAH